MNEMAPARETTAAGGGPDEGAAFERFVRDHRPALLSYVTRMARGRIDAEDVVQTALILAHRSLQSGLVPARSDAWIRRLAANALIDALRRKETGARHEREYATRLTEDPALAEERAELREKAAHALSLLPAAYREILGLRFLRGLSYQDISRIRGTPVGTLKASVSRGLGMLRQRMEFSLRKAVDRGL